MAKKQIEKLIPTKKVVYNPKIGKSVEITYYLKPKETKKERIKKEPETEKVRSKPTADIQDDKIKEFMKAVEETPYGKDIAKQLLCNI